MSIITKKFNLTSKHIGDINNLLEELKVGHKLVSRRALRDIVAQRNVRIFITRMSGRICGMAILRWHDLPVGRVANVEYVIVSSVCRGRGIGVLLMQDIVNFAKRNKIAYIDLTSKPERVTANKLYQKMGWKMRKTNCYRLSL